MVRLYSVFITCAFLTLAGCSDSAPRYEPEYGAQPARDKRVYLLGVHPLHNPERLNKVFGPFVEYINRNVSDFELRLDASRDYAAYNDRLRERYFHLALPNPYQTIMSLKYGYNVFGKMGDDENFRGIILVRADSGIKSVAGLKGKAVSFPAPTALAATMLPQYYLHEHGINLATDITVRYSGSQESSIMNVYHGLTAAGATWPPPWKAFSRENPEKAKQLRILVSTESLQNNGLVARSDVPPGVVGKVSKIIFAMHKNAEGRKILSEMDLSRFEPATNDTYWPAREFLARFERAVRLVE